MADRVLGVDASKTGWIGIVLDGDEVSAVAAASIAEVVALAEVDGEMTAIGIDIPIGLSNTGLRQADLLARGLIGPRRSSVFTTPVRAALEAADHATAVALNRQATGQGVSIQAYGLRAKILQVDAWLSRTGRRVAEVHPEVCFARMAGRPLQDNKTTWAGMMCPEESGQLDSGFLCCELSLYGLVVDFLGCPVAES
jgi:predicted RNase H-like nuclease